MKKDPLISFAFEDTFLLAQNHVNGINFSLKDLGQHQ